jgi:signal recognition particle subunit SRP54
MPDGINLDDRELTKIEAMISSMTNQERRNPSVFVATSWEEFVGNSGKKGKRRRADYNPSRVRRVALGCGRPENDVRELLQKFGAMRQMMVQLGASTGLMGKIPGLKQFSQMKRLAGMDLSAIMGGEAGALPPGVLGGGAALPAMQIPGAPPGFTPPGTRSGPPPAGLRSATDRAKKKNKRKQEKAARKKSRKRR